jgi:hypothetical protein
MKRYGPPAFFQKTLIKNTVLRRVEIYLLSLLVTEIVISEK